MENNAQNSRLDDFILKRLNAQDRSAFIDDLKEDAKLQEELKIREVMVNQVKTIGNLKLKDRILAIQSDIENKEEKKGIVRFIKPIIAAAAILLLLVIGYQWMNVTGAMSNQDLFAQNYQAYELPFGDRGNGLDNAIHEAGAMYQQQKYADAIPMFEQLAKEGKGDDRTSLALGISYIELKKYEKAILILKQASAQSGFLYLDQAQWYMGLAHLQLGQIEESKTLLHAVKDNPDARFKNEAKELLSNLE